jgi:anti-sigma regulatory factor (Ser/Thr protein kinase)
MAPRTIELTIRNELADISEVRDALDRFGAEHGVPDAILIDLQVVLDEIISNVIKYAWPEGGAHELVVSLTAEDTAIEVEVIDDGRPYDPRDAAPLARAPPGSRPAPGGVGIHLVRQLVDGFEYERVGRHNRTRLTKRCCMEP